MSKKQRPSATDANVKLDAVVDVPVLVAFSFVCSRPTLTIVSRRLRLPCPAGIVKITGNSMCGRSNRQQIGDHRFVISSQPMIDAPRPLGRPMPEQCFTVR